MKLTRSTLLNLILIGALMASCFLMTTTAGVRDYDPWCDLNDDGKIRVFE